MKAVVMAGGEGSRLRPITSTRPKPLVPVVNRPILWHVLNLLREHGFTENIITLHYLAEQVTSTFGDGSDMAMKLSYSFEDQPLGTAGSVKAVQEQFDGRTLVISGDVLCDFNLTDIVSFHKRRGALVTLAVTRVPNPLEYGVVFMDQEGKVQKFLEKPGWSEVFSDTVNAGVYVVEPEALNQVEVGKESDFSRDLFPKLLKRREPIYATVADGFWCDVGLPSQYLQAHQDILDGKTRITVPGKEVDRKIWMEEEGDGTREVSLAPPVAVGRQVQISRGARIGPYASIGSNVVIEPDAKIQRAVVFDASYVGREAEVKGCVLGKNVVVRPRARIFEGAIIGDRCQLGSGSEVFQNVRIWPDKLVEAGAVVRVNLIWGLTWHRRLFGDRGISGLANIEITPETTARLGAAFGSFIASGGRIVAARDTLRSSRMLKRSFLAGLLSAGVDVYNLRAAPISLARLAVVATRSDGGVYFGLSGSERESVRIQLFDNRGFNVSKADERKIENILFKEDIRRASFDEVADIFYPPRVQETYEDLIRDMEGVAAIAASRPKIVIDCSNGATSLTAPQILAKIGCDIIVLNSGVDMYSSTSFTLDSPSSLRDIVLAVGAVAGFKLSLAGDSLRMVDDSGATMSGDESLAVMTEVMLSFGSGKVALPVSASRLLEKIAERHGSAVTRVKTEPRAMMEAVSNGAIFGGNDAGEFIVSPQLPFPDGVAAVAKIASFLSKRSVRLSQVKRSVYQPTLSRGVVLVPWNDRGQVMRRLVSEVGENRVETVEGVKVLVDDGWVLITPSSEEPVFHVVAEASSPETATRLLREYQSRISELAAGRGSSA